MQFIDTFHFLLKSNPLALCRDVPAERLYDYKGKGGFKRLRKSKRNGLPRRTFVFGARQGRFPT
jgi:hypothetical protein